MKKTNNKQIRILTTLPQEFRARMKIFSIKNQIPLEELDVACLKKGFTEIEKTNDAKLLNTFSEPCDFNQQPQG